MYKKGEYVKKNNNKFMFWLQKSASEGCLKSEIQLGKIYKKETLLPNSKELSFYWFKKAALKGSAIAEYYIGYDYENSIGLKRCHYKKASYWFNKSAKQKYLPAKHQLEIYYCLIKRSKKLCKMGYNQSKHLSIESFRNGDLEYVEPLLYAAMDGDPIAQFWESSFDAGAGHYKRSVYWLKKAVKKKNVQAEMNLGNDYLIGQGVPKSYSKAIYYLKESALKGFNIAEYDYGIMYYTGKGVQQSYQKANYWFKKSANKNYAQAANILGFDYMGGLGCNKNYLKANYWFAKAMSNGSRMGEYNFALNLYRGIGMQRSRRLALEFFKKLEKKGGEAGKLAKNTILLSEYSKNLNYYTVYN